LRYYKEITGQSLSSIDALLLLAEKKDSSAIEAVTKMCTALGRGMHMIVMTLAPSEIVIVGEFTRLWSLAYPIIDAELRKFPLTTIPGLRMASEPESARLRSAVALVMAPRAI
jgi:predicted NBD/HSP70 family sugar kinase